MSSDRRLELHEILCEILGSRHVYYQPPESVKMEYPAIVYVKDMVRTIMANDDKYLKRVRYAITLIDKEPDTEIFNKILDLPLCSFDRQYTADNLYHDTFTLYY